MVEYWELHGKHNSAKVYAPCEQVDELAKSQVTELANNPDLKNAKLVFMPDVHGGKGATIGTTMKFNSLEEMKVNPEWVGNDIGCSVSVFRIGTKEEVGELDFDALDKLSKNLHKGTGHTLEKVPLDELYFIDAFGVNTFKKIKKNLGRISGGNHFLEIGEMNGAYYLSIHNGSLFLGQQVYNDFMERMMQDKVDARGIIRELKSQGKEQMIQPLLRRIKELERLQHKNYLNQQDLEDYIYHVVLCTVYARTNHVVVADRVFQTLGYGDDFVYKRMLDRMIRRNKDAYRFSPHNYVDNKTFTVFKGAASAQKGEDVIIPINMRDGIIVGTGKGNTDWNEAAPHGAGRLMSRTKAKENIELDTYLEQMRGVRSISINENTLDEAPDAYKPIDYIMSQIEETVEITGVIKPLYSFKVAEEEPHWMKVKREKRETNDNS